MVGRRRREPRNSAAALLQLARLYAPLIASLIVLVMCYTLAWERLAYELTAKAPREGLVHALGWYGALACTSESASAIPSIAFYGSANSNISFRPLALVLECVAGSK